MTAAPNTIVFDLDGTLCNTDRRVHLAQQQQWDEFHRELMGDPCHPDVAWFMAMLPSAYQVIALTGRNEAFRNLTHRWLEHHQLSKRVDVLLMRPDDDFRPDHELKPELLQEFFGGTQQEVLDQVIVVLDDREKVVEAWRNYGLPCWQVRPGGY